MRKFNQKKVLMILDMEKTNTSFNRIEIDYNTLKSLVLLNLIDESECQNYSPSISEFLEFFEKNNCSNSEVIFEAYLITDREDARLTVEGIRLDVELSSEKTKKMFENKFSNADEFSNTSDECRAWWD